VIEAVIFDLDGLLLDTEQVWDDVREALTRERGGRWHEGAQADMMGMSSTEWSQYMHDELGLPDPPEELNRLVVERMKERYREQLPVIDGAVEAVRRIGERWPLGLASSSNRPLIDLALELLGVADLFRVTVSSEEVERGKPAPDVYLAVASALGADPTRCVAAEDSSNGLRAAAAARMAVIALPNPHYPPSPDALSLAAVTVGVVGEVTPRLVEQALIASPAAS
jgi:HAD superfamily hydrolase (TIGR01509 family)